MFKKFIKGRTYFLSSKRKLTENFTTIKRFAKLKRKIQQTIKYSLFNNVLNRWKKKRKKHLSESYFCHYILTKNSPLFKRTVLFDPNHTFQYQGENTILMDLREDLKRQEANKALNTRGGYKSSLRPLSVRSFSFGRVYLTHRRRNTFITINKLFEDYLQTGERVVFKASCGLLDYIGPKRATFHARLNVAKNIGSYLAENEFTSIDIIFSSGIGAAFTRLVRVLYEKQVYVRYLIVPKRRSHGFTRKKKKRRL